VRLELMISKEQIQIMTSWATPFKIRMCSIYVWYGGELQKKKKVQCFEPRTVMSWANQRRINDFLKKTNYHE
jgi:hypothetical protein